MENDNKKPQEEIKPLFEDMGNIHIHDEKSYQDLKDKN